MKNSKLTVAMNGTVVGSLYRNGKGAMSWQYAQSWLQTPGARVISQSLPLTPRRQDGEAVYNFFSNLLPDSQAIIARMQMRFKVATDHILSAFPILGAKGISAQKAKMAMALQGKNRQYHWAQIQPRHFPATAERVGFSASRAKAMMREIGEQTPEVIASVSKILPADFPPHISEAIFRGMEKQAERLLRAE